MIRNAAMEIHVPRSRPPRRFQLHPGRFLAAFVLAAILLIAAHALVTLRIGSMTIGLLLILSLVLIAALSAGRGLLTPSLKELAFYFFAIMATGAIWPGAHLAISTYKDAGFVALAAFMIFVFVVAVALAVLSAYLLAASEDDS
jgi:ABC-type transport system involved in cytochrome c biogenesis permease subunit